MVEFERISGLQRDMKRPAAATGLSRPAPNSVALAMLGAHADQVGFTLACHDAQSREPDQVGGCVRDDVVGDPLRPWDVTAVEYFERLHSFERVVFRHIERDCPIPKRAPAREHVVRHPWRRLQGITRGEHTRRRKIPNAQ
jgi:hypothetical protein